MSMNAEIYHLPFEAEDSEPFEGQHRIEDREFRYRLLNGAVSGIRKDDFDARYNYVGSDDCVADDDMDALAEIWPHWNAGSDQECDAFVRRECQDCDEVFDGRVASGEQGAFDLSLRQKRAHSHEDTTNGTGVGGGHTVEQSTRSLSTGDIVIVDDTAYLCEFIGWSEMDLLGGL